MKVGIYSLGCKVNIYESEYVEKLLKNNKYEIVSFDDDADIYIINTCSVTNEADKKSRKVINRARRNHPDSIIVVMGCYSQIKSDDIDADIIIGNKDKSKIVELLDNYINNNVKYKKIYNLRSIDEFESMRIDGFDNHTRAFVKIQDGCNAFCSYCIIPYTRGKIRSKKKDDVIKEVTNLVRNGYKEIVLTGIHTGKYGMDLEDTNLEDLLRNLIKIDGIYRIRLSSIEINEITDGILELMNNSDVIANHLHIPIQSGSDKILKSMNRRYDKEYFINRIKDIRNVREDISITTDLIVGFPGETDDDFNETIDTLKDVNFTKIHTFPYSKREGTVASLMDDQIDGKIKKKRVSRILELSDDSEIKYYKSYIGKLLDGVSEVRKDGTRVVLTSNYISVIVNEDISNNEITNVIIDDVKNDKVYGRILKKD